MISSQWLLIYCAVLGGLVEVCLIYMKEQLAICLLITVVYLGRFAYYRRFPLVKRGYLGFLCFFSSVASFQQSQHE